MMKSRVPFFSVITSTHLRAPLLRRALQSLRAQTFQDFEIIVAADAMDAETGAVVAELLGENDTFIKHNAGPGPATSRNAAMQAMARGALDSLGSRGVILPTLPARLMTELVPSHPHYFGELVWLLCMLEFWLQAHAPDYKL